MGVIDKTKLALVISAVSDTLFSFCFVHLSNTWFQTRYLKIFRSVLLGDTKKKVFCRSLLSSKSVFMLLLYRFGIEMVKPHADQGDIRQADDLDNCLSEGFHWESVLPSDSPPCPCPLPSSSQSTAVNNSIMERPSNPLSHRPLEEPNTALADDGSIQAMMPKAMMPIKVEPVSPGWNDVPSGREPNADHKKKRRMVRRCR